MGVRRWLQVRVSWELENSALNIVRLHNFTQVLFAKDSSVYSSTTVVVFIVTCQIF